MEIPSIFFTFFPNSQKKHQTFKMNSTNKKLPSSFFIEKLLGLNGQNQAGGGNGNDKEKGDGSGQVKKLDDQLEVNEKFKMVKLRSRFSIEGFPGNDPEELLLQIFNECIDQAIQVAKERGIRPDKLGALISSEMLTDDIWVPVRSMHEGMPEEILNIFMMIAQR
jgi:hypothetical protein